MFCFSMTPIATAASAEEEVLQLVVDFHKAFNTGDFALFSSLVWHSPKVSLFGPPMALSFLRRGWEAQEAFFKPLLSLPGGTFGTTFHNPEITMLGDDVAVVTFYQLWTINPPLSKESQTGKQRSTLVVQKIGGKWLIVHNHGSVFP
jgi:ketosteroid isomerase-like protein